MPTTVSELLARDAPVRWLFTGDSITHGAEHTAGRRDYVQLFEERVRWELRRTRDHVIRTAVSGRTLEDVRDDFSWSVAQYRPHALFLMIGLNDANRPHADVMSFRAGLLDVIDRASTSGIETVVLQTPNEIGEAAEFERSKHLPAFVEAVRDVAAQTDAVLVDHYAVWGARRVRAGFDALLSDAVHPGSRGHRLLFRTLADGLGI